jgi:ABC-type transport system involved in Fe-S cluster assembly fused permease/ATPase subunit
MFSILKSITQSIAINTIKNYCIYFFPIIESLYKTFSHYAKLTTTKYIEPSSLKGWTCLVYFNNNNKYVEYYNEDNIDYHNNYITKPITTTMLCIQRLPIGGTTIGNNDGFYLYNNEVANATHEKSSVFFFTITLIQKKLHQEIILKKDEYIIGNQLLSKLHILRYVKYNGITGFTHDEPYVIEIMDNKFNIFNINQTQYVLLKGKHTYEIHTL